MSIPEVPYRFGERYLVTDFIQYQNIAIVEQANALMAKDNNQFISKTADWVRDNFSYPLDRFGNPSAGGQLLKHPTIFGRYHFKKCVYYMWTLPNEVLVTSRSICICTANLVASILRAKALVGVYVCLGDVRSTTDDTLVGRHAWVEVSYLDKVYVMETTVHSSECVNMILANWVYDKHSRWAINKGIYYIPEVKYNESECFETGFLGSQIVPLMGLPAYRVMLFGIESTQKQNPKKLFKEWQKEEILKEKLLLEAYRGGR